MTAEQIILAGAGLVLTGILYVASQARQDARDARKDSIEVRDRVNKLEAQMNLILTGMINFAGPKVHSPHVEFAEIDELIDKQAAQGLDEDEICRLIALLDDVSHSGPEEKRPAAAMLLHAMKARYMPMPLT